MLASTQEQIGEKEFAAGLLLSVARGPRRSKDSHISPSQIMNASSNSQVINVHQNKEGRGETQTD